MADLDSRSKRASSVGIGLPYMVSPILPDGTLSQGDRQHVAFSYSGIDADPIIPVIDYEPESSTFYTQSRSQFPKVSSIDRSSFGFTLVIPVPRLHYAGG